MAGNGTLTDVTIELKIGDEVWYPGGMSILNFKVVMMPQLLNSEAIVSSMILSNGSMRR